MSKIVNKLKSKIRLSRKVIIVLLILSLLGFIVHSSIGGSITNQFDQRENSPEFQDDPDSVNLPNSGEDGFNYSNFGDPPEGLNPPANLIDDILGNNQGGSGGGGSGNLPDLDPPENPPPDGGGGGFPGIPSGDPNDNDSNNDDPNDGGPIDNNPPPSNQNPNNNTDSNRNNTRNAINLPEQPNKARNLYNLSNIELFPNTNASISINIQFPKLPSIGFSNLLFLVLIFTILYLPKTVISRLILETKEKGTDSDGGDNDSPFFKPEKSAVEIRREKERRRKLLNFADYIQSIIEEIRVKQNHGLIPKDIITYGYLELDEAFANFMSLKRDKSLTPLEHAQEQFESHEIDNEALNYLVDLFYRSRFGNKVMDDTQIEEFIENLDKLVKEEDVNKDNKFSRWSLF